MLIPLINPQTAATTNKSVTYHAMSREVAVLATGLATTETIVIYVAGSGGWTALFDSSGTQIKLTATKPQLILPGCGLRYAFDKDATAGAAGLDACPILGTP